MKTPELKELLEAGAHFGHQTRRWNPKMGRYIYGVRDGIHIIDLTKTGPLLEAAQKFVREVTAEGGQIMFVGTKRQAKPIIKGAAQSAGMPFVTERWLGGMLTNFRTIRSQVNRLKKLEAATESGEVAKNYNKKEAARIADEIKKLAALFDGIRDMDQLPAALFVVDTPREHIAIAEAAKLGIPVVAIADTNSDPDEIAYPIPANDDAIKNIRLITEAIAQAAGEGRGAHQAAKPQEEPAEKPVKTAK